MKQKDAAEQCWMRMAEADQEFGDALRDFLKVERDRRLFILREGLSKSRQLTLRILEWVPVEERKDLLPDLLYLARAVSGYIFQLRKAILSLPKEWLLTNIETAAEPILRSGADEEYRRFLELYFEIDPRLTKRLAERALTSTDPNIREAGEDFIEKLNA